MCDIQGLPKVLWSVLPPPLFTPLCPQNVCRKSVGKIHSPVAVSNYTVRAHPLIPPHDFISLSLKYKEES